MKRPLWWPTWLEDPTWVRLGVTALAFVGIVFYTVYFWSDRW